jgi:hypothetical protein
MRGNNPLVILVVEAIAITGFVCLVFLPFISKRIRPRWAKGLFFAIGLIGIACYSMKFALNAHWLVVSASNSYRLLDFLSFINGLLLGWTTALFFSGQVMGKRISVGNQ